MISMTWIPKLLRGVVWIYLLLWAGMTVLTLWLLPSRRSKLAATLSVLMAGDALNRIKTIQDEVARLKTVSGGGQVPQPVPTASIEALNLNYQLAVFGCTPASNDCDATAFQERLVA